MAISRRAALLVLGAALPLLGAAGDLPAVPSAGRRAASPAWRAVAPGVTWHEVTHARPGEPWDLHLVVVKLDPRRVTLALDARVDDDGRVRPWSIEEAPAAALVALNAGQFTDAGPWGWVVHRGREHRAPGSGPLSMALVVDTAGGVALLEPHELAAARASGAVVEALQSYPALLTGVGELPLPLRRDGLGLDRHHRDSRLAVGLTREGEVLLVLTRVVILGQVVGPLPTGPTAPEMAAVMRRLGAVRAMMLDGGLSSQLRIGASRFPAMRKVPLGITISARGDGSLDWRAGA